MRSTILVVDDDQHLADTCSLVLNRFRDEFVSFPAYDVRTALQILRGIRPDLVLLAAIMPDAEKLEHAITMRDVYGCNVLLMSGYPETTDLLDALSGEGVEPFEILAKPTAPLDVIAKIRNVLSKPARAACP